MYRQLSYEQKLASYNARTRKGDLNRIFKNLMVRNGKEVEEFLIFSIYGFSKSHICNVLAGRRKNKRILNAAYRLSYRRKTNKSKF